MSALSKSPPWAKMDYEERCQRVWRLSHEGLSVKQIAHDLGCEAPGHVLAFARSEGISIIGRRPSPDWPTKDSPGWSGESLDTRRRKFWERQRNGARRALADFHAVFPANNTEAIPVSDTSQKLLETPVRSGAWSSGRDAFAAVVHNGERTWLTTSIGPKKRKISP